MKKLIRTYGSVVLSMIFWSFSFIWFKIANKTFHPIAIVFIRLVISAAILSTYLYITGRFIKIKREDRKLFFLLAFFEPFLYFLGESHGLTFVSATVGSVLISTIPVVATLGAWIFFRERLKIINYVGIIISFIGILIFIINRNGTLSFNIKGLILLLFAVFSAVGYNLTLSRLVGNYNPVFIVNVQNVIGSMLFMPLFFTFELNRFLSTSFSFKDIFPIIELAVFASCGAFILFAFAMRNLGISRANVFTNCIPIFTAFFSFIILGESLTFQNIAGMLIVIAGLFMSQLNGIKKNIDTAMSLTGKTA